MRLPAICAHSVAAFLAISAPAAADVRISQSNDPAAAIDSHMSQLHTAERRVLQSLPPDSVQGIDAPRGGAAAISFDPNWLASLPAATGGRQWSCLTRALYFEARGEAVRGRFAVAEVVLNRVDSPRYPNSVCEVVHQGTGRRHACQFSFTCDGRPEVIREAEAYEDAGKIARLMLDGAPRELTAGATHFHTRAVNPAWARAFPRTASIGAHLFYRQPSSGS